jgi:hypothetical protein
LPTVNPLLAPALRVDDRTIPDGLIVWRELDPAEAPIDPHTNQRKIQSSVFRTQEMSVRLSDKTSLAAVRANAPGSFIAEFAVGRARIVDCIIARDPNDPSHGLIYDKTKPGDRAISKKAARHIRDNSNLIT